MVGANRPALRLDQRLDFDRWQNMSLQLLVRVSPGASSTPHAAPAPAPGLTVRAGPLQDTREENTVPSHTATATVVLEVQPADLRPPWFLPCVYSDPHVCVQAQYHGAVPTGHRLVLGTGRARARVGPGPGAWVTRAAKFCCDFPTSANVPSETTLAQPCGGGGKGLGTPWGWDSGPWGTSRTSTQAALSPTTPAPASS